MHDRIEQHHNTNTFVKERMAECKKISKTTITSLQDKNVFVICNQQGMASSFQNNIGS